MRLGLRMGLNSRQNGGSLGPNILTLTILGVVTALTISISGVETALTIKK